jgi:hypothetical protein
VAGHAAGTEKLFASPVSVIASRVGEQPEAWGLEPGISLGETGLRERLREIEPREIELGNALRDIKPEAAPG